MKKENLEKIIPFAVGAGVSGLCAYLSYKTGIPGLRELFYIPSAMIGVITFAGVKGISLLNKQEELRNRVNTYKDLKNKTEDEIIRRFIDAENIPKGLMDLCNLVNHEYKSVAKEYKNLLDKSFF